MAACSSSRFVASGISADPPDSDPVSDPDMFSALSARARRVVALTEQPKEEEEECQPL